MLNRRHVLGLLAALPAGGIGGQGWAQAARVPFYNATGPELFVHSLDVGGAGLSPVGAVTLPRNVQYAWAHPNGRFFYVAASDGGPGNAGTSHSVTTFRVDPASGMLAALGVLPLAARPLHNSVTQDGRFLLLAYNNPSMVTVHAIGTDGLPGAALPQPDGLDFGIYAHQVRLTPDGRTLAVVARGNNATAERAEDPGAIKLFRFDNGRLANLGSFAPGGNGLGFGPRHLDFHPERNFAVMGLERQNELVVYGLMPDGNFSREPLFRRTTLRDPKGPAGGVGPIHFHPAGHVVYVANRGSGTVAFEGRQVSNGGENSIAVFALNRATGEPRHIQSIDVRGFETRTFTIDPTGRLLIAACQSNMLLRDGRTVRAGLSFFRIGADGRLTFLRRQDVDVSKGSQFWSGLLTMA